MSDYTDQPELNLLTIADELEAETDTKSFVWLKRMAQGHLTPGDKQPLIIRTDHRGDVIKLLSGLSKVAPLARDPERIVDILQRVTVEKDLFAMWFEQFYPLPVFWFGMQEDPAPLRISDIKERNIYHAEKYVVEAKAKKTPHINILDALKDKFEVTGQAAHDLIYPDKKDRSPGSKNTALSRLRNKE